MRIVTWNVNSMKSRLPRFTTWLVQRQPDVVLVQETKATDATWPAAEMLELGYESAHLGTGRWNGVAVLSRVGLTDIRYGLADQPSFEGVLEPRSIGATCGGIRLWSLYVPNGRSLGHAHYDYKLGFLAAVQAQAAAELRELGAQMRYGLFGDFNIAPNDDDVWDSEAFAGRTHVSEPERLALAQLRSVATPALTDLMPRASADPQDGRHPYTFWEMRMLGFQKGRGMRIDLALANSALTATVAQVWVDRDTRKGEGPSDHAPLIVDVQ